MAKTKRELIADIDKKITDLTIKRTALAAQADAEVNYAHVVEGAVVEFSYGKGESVRKYEGSVVAVAQADPTVPKSAPQVRVAFGSGMTAQIVTVYLSKVERVISSPVAVAAPADETPAPVEG